MFIRPESKDEAIKIKPNFTVVSAPHFKADQTLMALNLKHLSLFHLSIKQFLLAVQNMPEK